MAGIRNPELQRLLAALNEANQGVGLSYEQQNGFQFAQSQDIQMQVSSGLVGGFNAQSGHQAEVHGSRRQDVSNPSSSSLDRKRLDRTKTIEHSLQDVPDPSGITTWPAALKHLTKHILPNEQIAAKIKHLINEQHKHERQWWTQREAIVTRQQGREGNQAKAAELLKSLGVASSSVPKGNPEEDLEELTAFDKKVYRSLTQMTADFDGQLKRLGIPFFAIKHEMVILESGRTKGSIGKSRIDRGELRELQKRMIQTLEDLFGEEV